MSATDEIPVTSSKPAEMREEVISIDPATMRTLKVAASIILLAMCVILIVTPLMGAYNTLVDSDIQVNRAAHNVQTDLERRADLLPNLAATVKGSADFEYKTQHDTFVQVAEARALASTQAKAQIAKADPVTLASSGIPEEAQVTQLLGNFVKLQEAYPDLHLDTVQQFRELSAQTTATENQILVDRQTYNAAVSQYQSVCKSFPTVLIAKYYGFNPDKYVMYTPKDQERAETVPTITFDFSNL
jgi:LemA protein